MKFIFSVLFFGLISLKSTSQDSIRIIASGTAYTKEKATFSALRNALEKGAGVYISSETVIQNEKLVFDEVASLSNGTIANYDIIESDFSDKMKEFNVTVSANIVVGKFVNLIKSKGVNVSFNGSSFVQNIKINNFYKNEEPKILQHFEDNITDEVFFSFFDKKILADEPKIYSFKKNDYKFDLDKIWKNHSNNDLLYEKRNSKDIFLSISGKNYINPFLFQFIHGNYKFNEYFFFKDMHDSLAGIIYSWKETFKNKPNWTPDEIKKYSNLDENKMYDWPDFREYQVFDSMNHCFITLNNELKANSGGYVINLTPVITVNKNYANFTESLKKTLEGICINKDASFIKEGYEEKFGKTYSIYLYEYQNGVINSKEYVLRNMASLYFYDRLIGNIGRLCSGKGIVNYNLIKSNLGRLDNYIVGMEKDGNNESELSEVSDHVGLIINPLDLTMPIAQKKQEEEAILFNHPKFSISQFADLKTIEKIKEFTIDNPPELFYLPARPESFLVDADKIFTKEQKDYLTNKLNQFFKTHGTELFIIDCDKDYGFDNIDDLSKEYGYEWEIGGKDKYDGIVININILKRMSNIHYGKGLDGFLTDKDAKDIIGIMTPAFKIKDYFKGAVEAIDFLENKLSTKK